MAFIRNEQMLEMIEESLARNCGVMAVACKAIGVRVVDVNAWLMVDPAVAERVKLAQLAGWSGLEEAAYRRGVEGIDTPVFQKGEIVGYKKEYSDGLLAQMLKARVPEYGADAGVGGGVTVNVAIMPRASTYEEWLVQRDAALALEDGKTVEAEWSAASEANGALLDLRAEGEQPEWVEVPTLEHTSVLRDL